MHEHPSNFKEREYHHRIRKVLAYIQENLAKELPLAEMAEIANFSAFHFQKIFKQYVGESPKQYVLRLRLERIAHVLKMFPEKSVFELSFQSGFSSPSTFGRAFKKHYGITPDEFRQLTNEEISKICTSKNKKGKEIHHHSNEFWNVNYDEKESVNSGLNIEIVKKSSLKIAFVESHMGSPTAVADTFKTLYNIAFSRDLINDKTRFIGIFLDLPFFTELRKCRFRACITLPENADTPKELINGEIPGGKYATYLITGDSTTTLGSLVSFKHQWLDKSGFQISEIVGYEEYLVNPAFEDYEKLERTIYIPVKPA